MSTKIYTAKIIQEQLDSHLNKEDNTQPKIGKKIMTSVHPCIPTSSLEMARFGEWKLFAYSNKLLCQIRGLEVVCI